MLEHVFNVAASRAGVKIEWTPSRQSVSEALSSGAVDLWVDAVIAPELERRFFVSNPYMRVEFAMLVRRGAGWIERTEFHGVRVAYNASAVQRTQIEKATPGAAPLAYPDADAAVGAVCAGAADGSFVSEAVLM